MSDDQSAYETLDLSERLRAVMARYKLSVAELAEHAGVSKSAMEKYLAGPSSPRATAIASLCRSLQLNAEWLIFGHADDDLRRIRDIGMHSFAALLQELKQPGSLKDEFDALDVGSRDWRSFSLGIAADRAQELCVLVADSRKRDLQATSEGQRVVALGPFPLVTMTEREFQSSKKTD